MLYTYSPKDVVVMIPGVHTVEGYADTFIEIDRNTKAVEKQRAMDGEIARMYQDEGGYTVVLSVHQSSSTNNVLGALYNLDAATHLGKFPFYVKDTSGSSAFIAVTAWVESPPTVVFSSGMEVREWTIGCSDAAMVYGGNAEQTIIEQLISQGSALYGALSRYGVV